MVVFVRWKLLANCEHVAAAAGEAAKNPITMGAAAASKYLEARLVFRPLLIGWTPPCCIALFRTLACRFPHDRSSICGTLSPREQLDMRCDRSTIYWLRANGQLPFQPSNCSAYAPD